MYKSLEVRLLISSFTARRALAPIASFVGRLSKRLFRHRKYLNRRIVYSSGDQGTFNPAVITNKEDML